MPLGRRLSPTLMTVRLLQPQTAAPVDGQPDVGHDSGIAGVFVAVGAQGNPRKLIATSAFSMHPHIDTYQFALAVHP